VARKRFAAAGGGGADGAGVGCSVEWRLLRPHLWGRGAHPLTTIVVGCESITDPIGSLPREAAAADASTPPPPCRLKWISLVVFSEGPSNGFY